MEEQSKTKHDEFEFTIYSDESEKPNDGSFTPSKEEAINFESSDNKPGFNEEKGKFTSQKRDLSVNEEYSDTIIRRFEQSLEKAIADIKKGGSLVKVSLHYNISEDVLYQHLTSRRLPKEADLLTPTEENKLLQWILKSNKSNCLVFKHELMEKVGRLKKVLKITPIFAKSKFGRMWYAHFLKKHPGIHENDGLLLPSEGFDMDYGQCSSQRTDEDDVKLSLQNFKEEPVIIKKDPEELLLYYGIKEAVVVLHDYLKENKSTFNIMKEQENIPIQPSDNKSDLNVSFNKPIECITENKPVLPQHHNTVVEIGRSDSQFAGMNTSSGITSKQVDKKLETKSNSKVSCDKCLKTFCNKYKLKRHLYTHIPPELYTISCYICSKRFPSRYHLNLHLKNTHSTTDFTCETCQKVFKHQTSLTKHVKKNHSEIKLEEKNFTCDMCGKCFKYKNSLEDHIVYGHLKEKKKFSCKICKMSFIKYSLMFRHKLRHGKKKPFSCIYCKKMFSRKYLARNHMKFCYKNDKKLLKSECEQISIEYLSQISLD